VGVERLVKMEALGCAVMLLVMLRQIGTGGEKVVM
jgi:hypothetical protein